MMMKHTHINRQTHTHEHTILRYIANYIKGRMAYTTFRNHTSTKRQFKSGVPQGGVLSPILFNIYTSDIPLPPDSVQLTTYAGTKRIQPVRGWCAAPHEYSLRVVCVPQSRGTVQIVSTYPASPEARSPIFWGKPVMRPRSMAREEPDPCDRH